MHFVSRFQFSFTKANFANSYSHLLKHEVTTTITVKTHFIHSLLEHRDPKGVSKLLLSDCAGRLGSRSRRRSRSSQALVKLSSRRPDHMCLALLYTSIIFSIKGGFRCYMLYGLLSKAVSHEG